jgi:serine/threonine-protein kinase
MDAARESKWSSSGGTSMPATLGGYHLVRRLAKGGMGEVWEAIDHARPEKRFAVKTLLAGEDDQNRLRKFLDEARIGAVLDHPNIVRTLDVGIDTGRLYMVMELLQGAPLSKLVLGRGKPNPPGMVVAVGLQVLKGLEHAQEATDHDGKPLEVVHRDLKPSNLFVTEHGVVKLIDFGIAVAANLDCTRTRTGVLRGSLPYFSPEQARNDMVDCRSDLFSLGLVLHELLTGRRVFDQQSEAAILGAVLWESVPRVRERVPHLPEALDEAVAWAVKRDPAERPTTHGMFAEVLKKSLPPEAIWTDDQLGEWVKHRMTAARAATPVASPRIRSKGASSGSSPGSASNEPEQMPPTDVGDGHGKIIVGVDQRSRPAEETRSGVRSGSDLRAAVTPRMAKRQRLLLFAGLTVSMVVLAWALMPTAQPVEVEVEEVASVPGEMTPLESSTPAVASAAEEEPHVAQGRESTPQTNSAARSEVPARRTDAPPSETSGEAETKTAETPSESITSEPPGDDATAPAPTAVDGKAASVLAPAPLAVARTDDGVPPMQVHKESPPDPEEAPAVTAAAPEPEAPKTEPPAEEARALKAAEPVAVSARGTPAATPLAPEPPRATIRTPVIVAKVTATSSPAAIADTDKAQQRTKQTTRAAPAAGGTGWLTVDARPTWAKITIDGDEIGPTPLFRHELKPGRHRVEAVRPDGSKKVQNVVVEKGKEQKIVVVY